jgi:hypothetical protein
MKHRVWPLVVVHAVGLSSGHTHTLAKLANHIGRAVLPAIIWAAAACPGVCLDVYALHAVVWPNSACSLANIVITSAPAILAAQREWANVEAAAAVAIMTVGVHALA